MKLADTVEEYGGHAILTRNDHFSGSDRVYEAYKRELKIKIMLI
jgi:CMP-2-keto-3-deoxyoctulosonic acid synthetase